MSYKKAWFKKDLNSEYGHYCPRECDSMSYLVSIRTLTNQYNSNNSFIQAYYRTLVYTQITQSPAMVLLDLISFLGGLTGLFLGASFLTFVEIFEMINGIISSSIGEVISNFCIN